MTIRTLSTTTLCCVLLTACGGSTTSPLESAAPLAATDATPASASPVATEAATREDGPIGIAVGLVDPAELEERPDLSRPPLATDVEGAELLNRALGSDGRRIVVSRGERYLWLMEGNRVVFRAPVAVGRDTVFRYREQSWDFSTPRGVRRVHEKEPMPLWVPPDWHYLELASERGLEPVRLEAGSAFALSDGTRIEVRDDQVGRVNQYGNFRAFRPGVEIIFDGFIFMPPLGSAQRRVPEVLGTHRLILGDGYLIHGTPDEDSIGSGASHGCVRMRNADVETLYALTDVGTAVYIY